MSTSSSKIHVGMDVHKDTVMIAVLPELAEKPTIVKQLPNDERALRRSSAQPDPTTVRKTALQVTSCLAIDDTLHRFQGKFV